MASDREVAGIRCMEVLAVLSDYLSGELADDVVKKVEGHLDGCSWCEQFGREFGSTVKELRTLREHGAGLSPAVAARLMADLETGK